MVILWLHLNEEASETDRLWDWNDPLGWLLFDVNRCGQLYVFDAQNNREPYYLEGSSHPRESFDFVAGEWITIE